MFEDSTFESTGRIKTRSRRWMFAAFTLNGSILVAMVLVPLIYPNALPSHFIPTLLVAPAAPQPETPPPVHVRPSATNSPSEMMGPQLVVPTRIPIGIRYVDRGDRVYTGPTIAMDNGSGLPEGNGNPFGNGRPAPIVRPPSPSSVRLPSKLVESAIIYKTIPQYPAIAKAARQEGTVVLQAMISKSGTIEHLQVVSGPPTLQQAAFDAVKTWRYRPYLLNDQPIEVETTVSVIFRLER
jgi:protein TonB